MFDRDARQKLEDETAEIEGYVNASHGERKPVKPATSRLGHKNSNYIKMLAMANSSIITLFYLPHSIKIAGFANIITRV